jgi:hypothetical protein
VVAAGGYLAAPLIAGYVGAAAGLSGAAAVAHGLALLGGGSLAAGGAGMAGGMLLVTSAGAAVGNVGTGGAAALWSAGYAAAGSGYVDQGVARGRRSRGRLPGPARNREVCWRRMNSGLPRARARAGGDQGASRRRSGALGDARAAIVGSSRTFHVHVQQAASCRQVYPVARFRLSP